MGENREGDSPFGRFVAELDFLVEAKIIEEEELMAPAKAAGEWAERMSASQLRTIDAVKALSKQLVEKTFEAQELEETVDELLEMVKYFKKQYQMTECGKTSKEQTIVAV